MSDSRFEEMQFEVAAFHKKHPEVWKLFVRFTQQRIGHGFSHYSVNAIFERIRWETDVAVDGASSFKLNNNYRAFYARRFMRLHPEHVGFFRTRKQLSKDDLPANRPPLGPDDFPTWPDGDQPVAP